MCYGDLENQKLEDFQSILFDRMFFFCYEKLVPRGEQRGWAGTYENP